MTNKQYNEHLKQREKQIVDAFSRDEKERDNIIDLKVDDNYDAESAVDLLEKRARFCSALEPIKVNIKAISGYSEADIKPEIKNEVKMRVALLRKKNKLDIFRSVIFVFFGIFLLALGWIVAERLSVAFVPEMLTITSWVFLWWAIETSFIDNGELRLRIRRLVQLYDSL